MRSWTNRPQYYVLEGHEPKPADSDTWARWWTMENRRVALDDVGDARVSTVFLGSDHNYSNDGPPLIFETLVMGGVYDQEMDRYSTWDEAIAGHKRMLEKVKLAHWVGFGDD